MPGRSAPARAAAGARSGDTPDCGAGAALILRGTGFRRPRAGSFSDVSLRWYTAVVFCHDVRAQSRWWAEVLGWQIASEDDYGVVTVLPPHLLDTTREIPLAERWPGLEFVPVADGEQLHNQLYITLAPPKDGDQEAEIRRLEALGAKVVTVGEDGVDWSIMEDPEGNGFSVYTPRD
jgi:catechol-2,3-dioxygenase